MKFEWTGEDRRGGEGLWRAVTVCAGRQGAVLDMSPDAVLTCSGCNIRTR